MLLIELASNSKVAASVRMNTRRIEAIIKAVDKLRPRIDPNHKIIIIMGEVFEAEYDASNKFMEAIEAMEAMESSHIVRKSRHSTRVKDETRYTKTPAD